MEGDGGEISRSGSWQNDPLHARLKTAKVNAIVEQADAYALTIALQNATTPRRAVFYDYVTKTYKRVFVPEVNFKAGRRLLHTLDFSVIEAL
jgi:hypothetical protein